jgi:hypothetical protein
MRWTFPPGRWPAEHQTAWRPHIFTEVTVKRESFWRLLLAVVRRPGATLSRLNERRRALLWWLPCPGVGLDARVGQQRGEARQGGGTL